MLLKRFFLLLLVVCSIVSYGQEGKARQIVKVLTNDSLNGRGYVNSGANRAGSFLEKEFEKSGLMPFIGDTSYSQYFTFDVNTFPGTISVVSDDYFFKPGIDFLVDEKSGSFNGNLYLLEIDSTILTNQEIFNEVTNKIVSGENNGFYLDLTKVSSENYRIIARNFNMLANLAPVVYRTDQKFIWSVSRQQLKYPIIYFNSDALTGNPSLLTINIEAEFKKNYTNKNIIGYIPAKKKNAKSIVFTAHYDHIGMMGTSPVPTYFPGANDNSCGPAMLLSLADYFVQNPLKKYNLIFMAFAGEEAGLLGSDFFVNSNEMDLSNIKFLINLDMVGSGEDGISIVNGKMFKKEVYKIQKINSKKEYVKDIIVRGESANSDHHYFYKAGVPAIFIFTRGINQNYHNVHDTYDNMSFFAYDNLVKLLTDFVRKL